MNNNVIKEISLRINNDMTDIEKYRVIYDYIVNNINYDYGILYGSAAHEYLRIIFMEKYPRVIREYVNRIDNYSKLSNVDKLNKILENISNHEYRSNLIDELEIAKKKYEDNNLITKANITNKALLQLRNEKLTEEVIILLINAKLYREKEEEYYKNNNIPKGNMFESGYGVCKNFSDNFKDLCGKFNLPCEIVQGQIQSNSCMLSHMWNAIVVDNELKFVDISGAIHSKDGTYKDTSIDDYFNKTYDELLEVDNGKNRTINDESMNNISSLLPNNKALKRTK